MGALSHLAVPSLSLSHKPFPGVYWRPHAPGLEGLPPRGADVPRRLPANAIRAAARVQAQGAADEAAHSHHWPRVQEGEPRPSPCLYPAPIYVHEVQPGRVRYITELFIPSVSENMLLRYFIHSCLLYTLTSSVIPVRPCVI